LLHLPLLTLISALITSHRWTQQIKKVNKYFQTIWTRNLRIHISRATTHIRNTNPFMKVKKNQKRYNRTTSKKKHTRRNRRNTSMFIILLPRHILMPSQHHQTSQEGEHAHQRASNQKTKHPCKLLPHLEFCNLGWNCFR
ncbi:hypothetical protein KC19_VG149300, partial [Ceratodon purpureus]